MSGLGATLNTTAHALSAIQHALDTVQNNVVNANTAGYAVERINFSALAFDPQQGSIGGVRVGFASARNQYLETSVRAQTAALGFYQQQSPLLNSLQGAFSASGDSGVPGALSSFANSFSVLSTSPNDAAARTKVIQAATTLAQAFNQAASRLKDLTSQSAQQASAVVVQINSLSAHIAGLNRKIQSGVTNDAGLSADLNSSLDSLSGLVNTTVSYAADGTASVLLDGQTPLVLGGSSEALQVVAQPVDPNATYPNAAPSLKLLDHDGNDVTVQASQGELGALIQVHNQSIPNYLGDSGQIGDLNRLAKTFADRVNQILTNGQVSAGPPPAQGSPLFAYDSTSDTKAAASLKIDPNITASQIATIDPGPPSSANGVAVELANLTNPSNSSDLIDGESYTSFYGQLAGQAGASSSQATSDLQTQQDLTTQAQNQRSQVSGVSLNEQAAQLLAFQQAYQATARLITVIDSLSQAAVNILPQS